MKIYFAGSVRAGRGDQDYYFCIINELKKYGEVLTEHLGSKTLSDQGEQGVTDEYIFERDIAWVRGSDVLVGEVTNPALGVGYEIGQAELLDKKIFLLYKKTEGKKLSVMLSGNKNLKIVEYKTKEEIPKILESLFKN
ncbi:MAG: nucleoside 2-deoxyribosyltransferase [bacterium]